MNAPCEAWNGEALPLDDVPVLPVEAFQAELSTALAHGARAVAFLPAPLGGGRTRVLGVMAHDAEGRLALLATDVAGRWPSLTPRHPSLQLFERELWEEHGLLPEGHPWLKPVRRSAAETPFFRVDGPGVHEVAVGPVHAGVIEPGHFRFGCRGEEVLHLEIALGYQHRGLEKLLLEAPPARRQRIAETIAGDTTLGHGWAWLRALEGLAGVEAPPRASVLRAVALELERLANHVGDLGMLAGDVGFQPTAAALGALRAEFLNATAEICGNRFGRSLLAPGGVRFDVAPDEATRLAGKVEAAFTRVRESASLFFEAVSVRNRTDGTGALSRETCDALGLVGVAARACGALRDVRRDHPYGIYRFVHLPVATAGTGDVFGRAWVRWLEAERSVTFVLERLRKLPAGAIRAAVPALRPGHVVVSLVEGWRGEIAHVLATDDAGGVARLKIVDPSFHNWFGLALALRGEAISDFPLCNKSFNLSYAGHDL